MCSIVGYVGQKPAPERVLEALKRLEYKGYDSVGLCFVHRKALRVHKRAGTLADLREKIDALPPVPAALGHTRWATHGEVTDANAHPHLGAQGRAAIVHNGIIDNWQELRTTLTDAGVVLSSDTDSEVIAHLLETHLDLGPAEAIFRTMAQLQGTYGLAVQFRDEPASLYAVSHGSPLLLGTGEGESYLASDSAGFAGHTKSAFTLQEDEVYRITAQGYDVVRPGKVRDTEGADSLSLPAPGSKDFAEAYSSELQGLTGVVQRALGGGGRLVPEIGTAKLGGIELDRDILFALDEIVFVGTEAHLPVLQIAAVNTEFLARITARVERLDDLREKNPAVRRSSLYIFADPQGSDPGMLALFDELSNRGARILGVVNSVGSPLARVTAGGVYCHAGGSQLGLASFTALYVVTSLLALFFGRVKAASPAEGKDLVRALLELPERIGRIVEGGGARILPATDSVLIFVAHGALMPIARHLAQLATRLFASPALAMGEGELGLFFSRGGQGNVVVLGEAGNLKPSVRINVGEGAEPGDYAIHPLHSILDPLLIAATAYTALRPGPVT